jgi:hypothetical protein
VGLENVESIHTILTYWQIVFEYEIVPAPNGADPVRLAEDIEDSPTPSSTATSFEELSPVPVIVSQSDGSVTKRRKKQESAVLTSAAFKEKLRESKQKSTKQAYWN